jgi:hypothetical protein
MALKQVTTNVDYIKWSAVAPGSVIQGFYIETKSSVKYPDNMNHYIETLEGKRYGLNGNANLDRALEQVRQGWYVEIRYDGMVTLSSGRFQNKECHQFTLAYDDERIHPLFSGDASARQEVQYKNSTAGEAAAPQQPAQTQQPIQNVAPQQNAAAANPPQQNQPPALTAPTQPQQNAAAANPPQQATPTAPKRSIF